MKSLSRIVKEPEEEQKVRPYDFFAGFTIKEQNAEKEVLEGQEEQEEPEEEEIGSPEVLLAEAEAEARRILKEAKEQAEFLRDEAYREGLEEGRKQGLQEAYEEQRVIMDQEIRALQRNMADVIQSISREKEKIIENSVDDLKKISLSVAEKIIQTSIQSSGDIVKRMILAATDKMKKRQWAKIYVTKCNTGVSMEVDTEFLEALSRLSDNVKIITLDQEEEGTCIIELPDEIVDASVGTQLENIKDIINNARI